MRWPPQLRELEFPVFSEGADYATMKLPETLKKIVISFVQPGMARVRWPSSLREMTCAMVERLVPLQWNDGLELLRLSGLKEPLVDWHPPSSLTEFHLEDWNLALTQLHLPPRLRTLSIGRTFNQPIQADDIAWPDTLETLRFGAEFNQSMVEWTPPPSLTHLELASPAYPLRSFTADGLRVPPTLKRFSVQAISTPQLHFSPAEWPTLEYLDLGSAPESWSNMLLPPRLHTLRVESDIPNARLESFLDDFRPPAHLECIIFGGPALDGPTVRCIRAGLSPTCALICD
jgi:hypothetical protein